MTLPNLTGREVIDVLSKLGQLSQAGSHPVTGFRGQSQLNTIPLMVWRFKEPNPKIEEMIVAAVQSFRGNVEWELEPYKDQFRFGNWSLTPKRLRQFEEEYNLKNYLEARAVLEKEEPEFGVQANYDVPSLAEHIWNYIESHLHQME